MDTSSFNSLFRRVNGLYTSVSNINNNSNFYGIDRQYNLVSKDSTLADNSSLVDKKGLLKFFTDTLDLAAEKPSVNLHSTNSSNLHLASTLSFGVNDVTLNETLNNSNNLETIGNLTDKKSVKNMFKFVDPSKKKTHEDTRNGFYIDELLSNNKNVNYS